MAYFFSKFTLIKQRIKIRRKRGWRIKRRGMIKRRRIRRMRMVKKRTMIKRIRVRRRRNYAKLINKYLLIKQRWEANGNDE